MKFLFLLGSFLFLFPFPFTAAPDVPHCGFKNGVQARVPVGEHSTSFPRRVSGKSLPTTLVLGRASFSEMEGRVGTTETTILKLLSGSEISVTNDSYICHCSALGIFLILSMRFSPMA